ncbi:MAG TPA: phosphoribosyltransferase family protein [Candidatus Krumholzibacteria bacterium]|nr:phosphoribosyltransferase family protein [Candidatus Krumholzibacteria bacterium]
MGLVGELARCALDFLIQERCHACGASLDDASGTAAAPLGEPAEVLRVGAFRVTTRLLCPACANRVRTWRHAVRVAGPIAGMDASLAVFPAFVTDERLLVLIHLLKFARRERIAPWLAQAMDRGLPSRALEHFHTPVLVPVPMERAARRRRGFNQAESIARALADRWRVPALRCALVKVRPTRPQAELGRVQRLVNLRGAFQADARVVRGARVLLVDDLVTTGATACACADALRHAGAVEVRVVCAGYRDAGHSLTTAFLQS